VNTADDSCPHDAEPPTSGRRDPVSYRGADVRGVRDGGQRSRQTRHDQGSLADDGEETPMPEYLIAFNDEWVPTHTLEQLREKSEASMAVIEEMKAAGAFVFANGGIDASTAVCSAEVADGEPIFTDGPYVETKEHLGGFTVVDVPDDEAARYWAGRLAVALDWPQEVHRFPRPGSARGRPERDRGDRATGE
jgi:hypothetical protein